MPPADHDSAANARPPAAPESAPQHVAGSASELAAPTQPVRDASRISELFCDDLERDVTIQLKGQDQPLQLVVPLAQLPQFQRRCVFRHSSGRRTGSGHGQAEMTTNCTRRYTPLPQENFVF